MLLTPNHVAATEVVTHIEVVVEVVEATVAHIDAPMNAPTTEVDIKVEETADRSVVDGEVGVEDILPIHHEVTMMTAYF